MALQIIKLHVTMEDSTEYDVATDQRDIAAWELYSEGKSLQTHANAAFRYMAWHSLNRTRVLKGKGSSWEAFTEACVQVESVDDLDNKSDSVAENDE